MFFFLNLDLSYWRYQNVQYFNIICADVVYLPEEKLSLFTHFLLQSKIFLMYIMYIITLAKSKILKNFRNTGSFL